MKTYFVLKLPDDHPTNPGRVEVDLPDGPSFRQGGQVIAGPFLTFEEANTAAIALSPTRPDRRSALADSHKETTQ